jgi:hypothetical protein
MSRYLRKTPAVASTFPLRKIGICSFSRLDHIQIEFFSRFCHRHELRCVEEATLLAFAQLTLTLVSIGKIKMTKRSSDLKGISNLSAIPTANLFMVRGKVMFRPF